MIRRFTGFLFGFVIAVCAGLAMLPAHSAQVKGQIHGVLAMVLALDAQGHIIGAQIIGLPKTLAECGDMTKEAQSHLAGIEKPPEVAVLVTACVTMQGEPGIEA